MQHIPGGVPAFQGCRAGGRTELLHEPDGAGDARISDQDARRRLHRHQAGLSRTTGASPKQTKPIYSAYTPPAPKKKKKVERTRFRETTRTFRQKSSPAVPAEAAADCDRQSRRRARRARTRRHLASMKPGKKEKIRFGKAPTKTLPNAPETKTEDAGAVSGSCATHAGAGESAGGQYQPTVKTRFSERAKSPKAAQGQGTAGRCAGSPAAGCRGSCRPPDAGRSAWPGRRHLQEKEEEGHHYRRQNAAERQEEDGSFAAG